MPDPIFKYPLDLLGTSPDNYVDGEAHEIGSVTNRIFIADYGPFFGSSVQLVDASNGRILDPVDDYMLVHFYEEASQRTGQSIYAGARIVNTEVSTSILFSAQMVGGEFSFSKYALTQAIAALLNDTRSINWGDLIAVPAEFNPAYHVHSAVDLKGLQRLVAGLMEVADAIRNGDTASRKLLIDQITAKFDAFDGKYIDTARASELIAGAVDQALTTALVESLAAINEHINTQGNAHSLTATDIDLGNLPNYAAATNQQAIEGNASDLLVTVSAMKAVLNNLLGDVASFGLTVVEANRTLVVGGKYYVKNGSTVKLPDGSALSAGDFLTINRARGSFTPRVTVFDTSSETIASDAGISRTLLMNTVCELKMVWSGAGWEAIFSVNKINSNGSTVVDELSMNR